MGVPSADAYPAFTLPNETRVGQQFSWSTMWSTMNLANWLLHNQMKFESAGKNVLKKKATIHIFLE